MLLLVMAVEILDSTKMFLVGTTVSQNTGVKKGCCYCVSHGERQVEILTSFSIVFLP